MAKGREALRRLAFDLDEITLEMTRIPLVLGPLGLFEGVLWCSIGGSNEALERFNDLQVKVDGAVKLRGWPDAYYPFLPHITFGSFDRSSAVNIEDLQNYREYPHPHDFEIGPVDLLESVRVRHIATGEWVVNYDQVLPPSLFSDVQQLLGDPRGASR